MLVESIRIFFYKSKCIVLDQKNAFRIDFGLCKVPKIDDDDDDDDDDNKDYYYDDNKDYEFFFHSKGSQT